MINRVYNIIDETYDKLSLNTLKMEITEKNADVEKAVNKFINEYDREKNLNKTDYQINFGYKKTLKDYKKTLNKRKPYSKPKNYREMTVKAKGNWKDIYEIAFGTPNETITTRIPAEKNINRIKIKEAI